MQNAAPRLPQRFNFAQHLLTLNEARGNKIAYRDDRCALSYADLAHRVRCFAAGLLAHGGAYARLHRRGEWASDGESGQL